MWGVWNRESQLKVKAVILSFWKTHLKWGTSHAILHYNVSERGYACQKLYDNCIKRKFWWRLLCFQVLDWMLGKGHAALLKRAELKTFVNFHGNEVFVFNIYNWKFGDPSFRGFIKVLPLYSFECFKTCLYNILSVGFKFIICPSYFSIIPFCALV